MVFAGLNFRFILRFDAVVGVEISLGAVRALVLNRFSADLDGDVIGSSRGAVTIGARVAGLFCAVCWQRLATTRINLSQSTK
jgi:hypothetical protein